MSTSRHSEIESTLRRFVDWAHKMGWRYTMHPYYLSHFARFLEQQGVHSLVHVDAALLLEYRRALAITRGPSTVNGYLSALRALWCYLQRDGVVERDVTGGLGLKRQHYFVPYLYGETELPRIDSGALAAVRQSHTLAIRFSRQVRRTAFCLLRDCGLRVSEACGLNVDDFDPTARTIRVERTKFYKTRVIPVPRSTCAMLNEYLKHRRWVETRRRASVALFPSIRGRRLTRGSLERPFKRLLCELNLYRARRREGRTVFGSTNLHALRHTYAVRKLERWQKQQRDVEHLLPLLSSYMGHACVTYTKHYLHLTPLLSRMASERFAALVLPLLDHHGKPHDDD